MPTIGDPPPPPEGAIEETGTEAPGTIGTIPVVRTGVDGASTIEGVIRTGFGAGLAKVGSIPGGILFPSGTGTLRGAAVGNTNGPVGML